MPSRKFVVNEHQVKLEIIKDFEKLKLKASAF